MCVNHAHSDWVGAGEESEAMKHGLPTGLAVPYIFSLTG